MGRVLAQQEGDPGLDPRHPCKLSVVIPESKVIFNYWFEISLGYVRSYLKKKK